MPVNRRAIAAAVIPLGLLGLAVYMAPTPTPAPPTPPPPAHAVGVFIPDAPDEAPRLIAPDGKRLLPVSRKDDAALVRACREKVGGLSDAYIDPSTGIINTWGTAGDRWRFDKCLALASAAD